MSNLKLFYAKYGTYEKGCKNHQSKFQKSAEQKFSLKPHGSLRNLCAVNLSDMWRKS